MVAFHLDKNSRDTYYEQIRGQLVLHLLSSNIKEGEKLPTIRQAAAMLEINPNTVFKIYRRLQADKLLQIRQGSGAFVCKSCGDLNSFNRSLGRLITETFHQAEASFALQPRAFANLMYAYISRVGSETDTYIVVNDDETKEIDARILRLHFRSRFVPIDALEFARPSPSTLGLIRSARGWITTRYHIDRFRKQLFKSRPHLIELKRGPRFAGDVLDAAAREHVLVVFQSKISCNHFREIVFERLYPGVVGNISFAAMEDANLATR